MNQCRKAGKKTANRAAKYHFCDRLSEPKPRGKHGSHRKDSENKNNQRALARDRSDRIEQAPGRPG
jgi:hypothetical protein